MPGVRAILTDNVIVQVVDHRARFVLLCVVAARPLIAVVATHRVTMLCPFGPGPAKESGGSPKGTTSS